MYNYIHSDLVMENARIDNIRGKKAYSEERFGDVLVCRLSIANELQSKEYGCGLGNYVTVYFPRLTMGLAKHLEKIVADEIKVAVSRHIEKGAVVLVAGIGNRRIAADSLGPLSIDDIFATRCADLLRNDKDSETTGLSICTLECGVLGETGIESGEAVRAMVREIGADIVVAIDALAARDVQRLMATVQISDTGISPGAGIGNSRLSLTEQTVGVPVVAIGIPTVVSASTIVAGALCDIGHSELCGKAKATLDGVKNMFVTPKECDALTLSAAKLLSSAINKALLEYGS